MAPNALPPRATLLLLALAGALFVLRLGQVPLLGPDEPRYVRVAVEMHRAGEWVTPTLRGEPWLEKPPLYYWLAGAAFGLFGETEAAARLPAVLAGLLLVGGTALFGARLHGAPAGLHAGFVLATSLLVFAFSRAATMDMLLAATSSAGMGLIALRLAGIAGPLAIPVAHAFLGFAVLAKGPLGLLLPALTVLAYLAATREWQYLRELFSPWAVAAFVLVALPWYVAIWLDQGQHFVDEFLLGHNVARFTSTVHNHPGGFWYYLPVLLLGLFPWSGLLLPALASLRVRRSRTDLLVLLWLLVPLVFLSLAGSKLPGYVLPCLPPLAILMGRAAANLAPGGAGQRATALVGLVMGAVVFGAVFWLRRRDPGAWQLGLPAGTWALAATFLAARAFARAPAAGLAVLRIAGAGFLLLLTGAAPTLLARLESGRDLFLPAAGRPVLAWGARRTAWMAGYYYNDGRVAQVDGLEAVAQAVTAGPALVLCGVAERRLIEGSPEFAARVLAESAQGASLLEVRRR